MMIILKIIIIIESINSNIYTENVIEARKPDRVLVKKKIKERGIIKYCCARNYECGDDDKIRK